MYFIVLSGLPGTGKSSLADAIGKALGIPVFGKDWLESVLIRCGFRSEPPDPQRLGFTGYELLTILAYRQLFLGQSVILDSVAGTGSIRRQWHNLALEWQAAWRVMECVCTNESTHQARLANRQRNIPGWHELAWSDVEHVRTYYEPWKEEHLILDMLDPVDRNISKAIKYIKH